MSVLLTDNFGRKIDYLRVSVTDRCNLRCFYCMSKGNINYRPQAEILTFEEIIRVVRAALGLGINKVRLTGGEPLLRRNVLHLIGAIYALKGLRDFSLTTNGVLLSKYAVHLKSAGLSRINISLDTLNRKKFISIANSDCLKDVLCGIDAAQEAGFSVKLNAVIIKGINDNEVLDFVSFCEEKKITLRFIEHMPLSRFCEGKINYLPNGEIKSALGRLGRLMPLAGPDAGAAVYYKIEGFSQSVGFISPMSANFCAGCRRLRLSCDGNLFPCLCSNLKINLKEPLRNNADDREIAGLIKDAVYSKPRQHYLNEEANLSPYSMSQIGG